MGTPKKPEKKKTASKSPAVKKPAAPDPKEKKRVIEDDEDEDYDLPLEELGGYESLEGFDEDDDY